MRHFRLKYVFGQGGRETLDFIYYCCVFLFRLAYYYKRELSDLGGGMASNECPTSLVNVMLQWKTVVDSKQEWKITSDEKEN